MNKYQKAVLSTHPHAFQQPEFSAFLERLGTLPETDDGLANAQKTCEQLLESVVSAHFALRGLPSSEVEDAEELVEETDGPLIREYFVFEILADKELPDCYNLEDVQFMTIEGPCVGSFGHSFSRRVGVPEIARALVDAGSEPEFFGLYGGDDD